MKPRSDTVCAGDIRNLCGLCRFYHPWASVGFRRVPVGQSGTETPSSSTVIPGSIRILAGLMIFLASVSFLGHPACPCEGVGYGCPKCNHCIPRKYSDDMWAWGGIFILRELPWASACSRSLFRVPPVDRGAQIYPLSILSSKKRI